VRSLTPPLTNILFTLTTDSLILQSTMSKKIKIQNKTRDAAKKKKLHINKQKQCFVTLQPLNTLTRK